ncbi:alpha-2-macroglobulin-like protein [Plakobranchus ocellatus]|uniref:Alpha-2-macroglobulin-like protein n=1 Tax=Plakobranchus ocellatus TaxID=259542 RepID=A0AAV4CX34_9GAST|nr:alpha-2-macroglobulin-like protein [Plakobranchus ocellatus]
MLCVWMALTVPPSATGSFLQKFKPVMPRTPIMIDPGYSPTMPAARNEPTVPTVPPIKPLTRSANPDLAATNTNPTATATSHRIFNTSTAAPLSKPRICVKPLDFQLGDKARPGIWKIEVNLDNEVKKIQQFTVKEYDPKRFEMVITTQPYILASDKTIVGTVCSRYLSGDPVSRYLSLALCWAHRGLFYTKSPYYVIYAQIDGCYTFRVDTANMKKTWKSSNTLLVEARIKESKNSLVLSQSHTGPEENQWPLKIKLDDNTNGFLKPGLPYHGKVIVTKLDGTPVSGETIVVRANSMDDRHIFSRTFTTDKSGEVVFVLCGGLTEITTIKIEAQTTRFKIPDSTNEDWLWKHRGTFTSSRSHVRYVRHWFSPSLSYVQLTKTDSPFSCGQRPSLTVLYTTREGSKVQFQYQPPRSDKTSQPQSSQALPQISSSTTATLATDTEPSPVGVLSLRRPS